MRLEALTDCSPILLGGYDKIGSNERINLPYH